MSENQIIPVGDVRFGDLRRTEPVARNFGYQRGSPVDRYYIERFLEENSPSIRGRVLEFGGDEYAKQFGGSAVQAIDVLGRTSENSATTIVADLADAPHIPSSTFDCIICTQVLQYVYDLRAALATLHRILKPAGVLLATMPGITPTDDPHWQQSWYWSFTAPSARRLFGDEFGDDVDVTSRGNVLSAVCFLHGLAAEELVESELAHDDPNIPFLITARAARRGGTVSA